MTERGADSCDSYSTTVFIPRTMIKTDSACVHIL